MIAYEKFSQNPDLKDKLLETGTVTLIEGTQDMFWGAGALLGSKILTEGKWNGRNELGQVLHEVREDLRRTENWRTMSQPRETNNGIRSISSPQLGTSSQPGMNA